MPIMSMFVVMATFIHNLTRMLCKHYHTSEPASFFDFVVKVKRIKHKQLLDRARISVWSVRTNHVCHFAWGGGDVMYDGARSDSPFVAIVRVCKKEAKPK